MCFFKIRPVSVWSKYLKNWLGFQANNFLPKSNILLEYLVLVIILFLQGFYDTMDAGYRDENGYIYVLARDDDIINVAGHRLSTAALEDVILSHPDVADGAVIGVPEFTKGEIPLCLYVLKPGESPVYS